jgi:hypothetical protein
MFTRTPDIFSYDYGIFDYDLYEQYKQQYELLLSKKSDINLKYNQKEKNEREQMANLVNKFGKNFADKCFAPLQQALNKHHEQELKDIEEKIKKLKNQLNYKILDFDIYEMVDASKKANITSYPVEVLENSTGYARKTYIYDYKYLEKGVIKVIASKELNSITDNINNLFDLRNTSLSSLEDKSLDVSKYVNLIKKQLTKYLAEKHRLSINTETNIYKFYDLIGYRIINNFETQGVLQVEMDFIQNINIKDNQIDTVELGNKD